MSLFQFIIRGASTWAQRVCGRPAPTVWLRPKLTLDFSVMAHWQPGIRLSSPRSRPVCQTVSSASSSQVTDDLVIPRLAVTSCSESVGSRWLTDCCFPTEQPWFHRSPTIQSLLEQIQLSKWQCGALSLTNIYIEKSIISIVLNL